MPELPEVETVRQVLRRKVIGKTITEINDYYSKIIDHDLKLFKEKVKGQKINEIDRRGKWLVFVLDDYYMLSHLRMEGKYHFKEYGEKITKHEHIEFVLDNKYSLRYDDTRKFGRISLFEKDNLEDSPFAKLGPEPWDNSLTVEYLRDKFKNKTIAIKTALLDQSIITGIGNIYADEILFASNINPYRKTNEINDKELKLIINNTKIILEKAITAGGTTIDSYESEEGIHGLFQLELMVHRRENKKCKVCGEQIIKTRIGGRGTYYCEKCQKNFNKN